MLIIIQLTNMFLPSFFNVNGLTNVFFVRCFVFNAINSGLSNTILYFYSSYSNIIFEENDFIGTQLPVGFLIPQTFICEQVISSRYITSAPFPFKGFSPTHLSRTPIVKSLTKGMTVEPFSLKIETWLLIAYCCST